LYYLAIQRLAAGVFLLNQFYQKVKVMQLSNALPACVCISIGLHRFSSCHGVYLHSPTFLHIIPPGAYYSAVILYRGPTVCIHTPVLQAGVIHHTAVRDGLMDWELERINRACKVDLPVNHLRRPGNAYRSKCDGALSE